MNKKEIRKTVFARRKAASEEEIRKNSDIIFEKLRNSTEYRNASTVFAYMDYNHEVMTRAFIMQAWKDGKKVAVPRVNGSEMNFYYITYFGQLEKGCMGILEPITHCPGIVQIADADEKALMIVPGVAFDPERHRVGYGGGFYDKYLSIHDGHSTAAVAFDFQIFDEVPYDDYDILPQHIYTEREIY